jgi:AAA domain
MTHPLLRKEIFVETAFEKRFQAMLRWAWQQRSWHVIVADPGAGKTMGIRDLIRTVGSTALLAVTAPKNDESEQALGNQLFTALGLPLRGRWSDRKPKLMGHLHQFGTQCLIVDDAQDLELAHLIFLKELTDQGRLQYDHPLGLCLVAAGRGETIPLKKIFDQPEIMWVQFRRRLDKLEPFCRIAGHASEEVREILAALETVYHELFPQLNLRQWTGSIYSWLTQTVLDPTNSGRVTMDHLMKLVTTALEWSYEAKATDVRAETLEKAASLLVLRRNTLRIIDGAGPSVEAQESQSTEQGNGSRRAAETKREREAVPPDQQQNTTETVGTVGEQVQTGQTPKCTFPGLVSIDLKRFLASSTQLVECPDCGRTRTLSPHKGVLRFKSHEKRKTTTPNTGRRWAKMDSDWDVVGEERNR